METYPFSFDNLFSIHVQQCKAPCEKYIFAQSKVDDITFFDCIKCLYRSDCSGVNLQQTTSTICTTRNRLWIKIKSTANHQLPTQLLFMCFKGPNQYMQKIKSKLKYINNKRFIGM